MPSDFYLYSLIKENLEKCGFEIIDICFPQMNFKYRDFRQKLKNFIHKTFLNDKSYKAKLRIATNLSRIYENLNRLEGKAEFALLIRPDIYPEEVIRRIKAKSQNLVGYQWDGLKRFPTVKLNIPLFDRFYVFDVSDLPDLAGSNIHFTTNFYFDLPRLITHNQPNNIPVLYFVGAYNEKRVEEIRGFLELVRPFNLIEKIFIIDPKRSANSEVQNRPLNYEENLQYAGNADIILDISLRVHNGLSFRIFESICYEKKLITNVNDIKYFDFYHPDNIFILESGEEHQLADFLSTPYKKLKPAIKEKYSFSNWINYLLDIEPFQPIDAPTACRKDNH